MPDYYATADVWIGNLDSADEADRVRELIETALCDYQATVAVTAEPYPGRDDA